MIKSSDADAKKFIELAIETFGKVDDWSLDNLNEKISELIKASELNSRLSRQLLKVALFGEKFSSRKITHILYLLGKENSLERLNAALNNLRG